jgi:prepilin-type N-terminal cleavage/methylation domain-containing protein
MRDDRGFTLVELIVAMAIFSVVMLATAGVVMQSAKTYGDTKQTIDESADRQVIVPFLTKDVERATSITTTATSCYTGTVVAHFSWSDTDAAGTTVTTDVVYAVPSPFVAPGTLTRTACPSSGTSVTSVIARRLAATPTLTCVTSCSTSQTRVTLTVPDAGGTFSVEAARKL